MSPRSEAVHGGVRLRAHSLVIIYLHAYLFSVLGVAQVDACVGRRNAGTAEAASSRIGDALLPSFSLCKAGMRIFCAIRICFD